MTIKYDVRLFLEFRAECICRELFKGELTPAQLGFNNWQEFYVFLCGCKYGNALSVASLLQKRATQAGVNLLKTAFLCGAGTDSFEQLLENAQNSVDCVLTVLKHHKAQENFGLTLDIVLDEEF